MDNLDMLLQGTRRGVLEYKLVIYKLIEKVSDELNCKFLNLILKKLCEIKIKDLIEAEIDLAGKLVRDLYQREDHIDDLETNCQFFFQMFFANWVPQEKYDLALKAFKDFIDNTSFDNCSDMRKLLKMCISNITEVGFSKT